MMSRLWLCASVVIGGVAWWISGTVQADSWSLIERTPSHNELTIQHPPPGAVLPANMPAPIVLWDTNVPGITAWWIGLKAGDRHWLYKDVQPRWHPPSADWTEIVRAAKNQPVQLCIAGRKRSGKAEFAACQRTHFTIATESLNTPLFYREVNLPFQEAVKDPSHIRWRFGAIDKEMPPPVVLENLPVCGNCHSFTRDGQTLAMDVDYANSKGSYVITKTAKEMRLATSDIITWDDFRKNDGEQTLGLLSQISPDGRYVLSTVKDSSVFVPKPDLAFSQLFFPLKGIIAVYDCQRKEFFPLPGADDPTLVQSNPTWSPDGKWVVFARNRAYELKNAKVQGKVLLTATECEEFLQEGKQFRFDLYRVPFNEGKGGEAVPLRGASGNGKSNFFPKYSPDGRWIVFCQANNYMLLQPDSELFIIPAEGGEPRKLGCNQSLMNSWHTWSPDGHWMVFTSKAYSPYSQLMLTHINERGEASPAVWLDHLSGADRAANIPEFVAAAPDAIARISEQFLDDRSYARAGDEFYRAGDSEHAIEKYKKALELNPNCARAHQRLGFLLFQVKGDTEQGLFHSREAIRLEPQNAFAHYDLGMALMHLNDFSNAVPHLETATRLMPQGYDSQYNSLSMFGNYAQALYRIGRYQDCVKAADSILHQRPGDPKANFLRASSMAQLGLTDQAEPFYKTAIAAVPSLAEIPDYYALLSRNYERSGAYQSAVGTAQKALRLASVAPGREGQVAELQQRIERCRRQADKSASP